MRALPVWLLAVASFIGLADLAAVWHGALFVLLIGPWAWLVCLAVDWANG